MILVAIFFNKLERCLAVLKVFSRDFIHKKLNN